MRCRQLKAEDSIKSTSALKRQFLKAWKHKTFYVWRQLDLVYSFWVLLLKLTTTVYRLVKARFCYCGKEATPPVAASDIPLEEGDRVKASLIEGGGSRRLTEGVLNGENAI